MCELSTKGLCPSAQKTSKSKTRKAIALTSETSTSAGGSLPKVKIEIKAEEENTVLYTIHDDSSHSEVKNEEAW